MRSIVVSLLIVGSVAYAAEPGVTASSLPLPASTSR
jgi:hypothetical protein